MNAFFMEFVRHTIHAMFLLRLFQNPKVYDQDQKRDVYTP